MEDIGAINLFDEVVVSGDVGMTKPQPGIYREMLKRLRVEAGESVFIDDAMRNVSGAQSEGMHGILYESFEQTKKELKVLLSG